MRFQSENVMLEDKIYQKVQLSPIMLAAALAAVLPGAGRETIIIVLTSVVYSRFCPCIEATHNTRKTQLKASKCPYRTPVPGVATP